MDTKQKNHMIKTVSVNGTGKKHGIEPMDELISINGQEVKDIFDYRFLLKDEKVELVLRKPDGTLHTVRIRKDYDDDLGIEFENSFMDDYKSCTNKCMFCFIDQMPPGMRDTLYFKDDDSRLSFLQGNYITLTNMSDADLDRIIRYHLAPINISIHTSNPELRVKMLHNRFAGESLKKIKKLYDAGIEMNSQIVLCPGINDEKELDRTIEDMAAYFPYMQSLSVVPVGITKYRDGLYPLTTFDKEGASRVIDQVEAWQKKYFEKFQTYFVHLSDEFYILAKRPLPTEERYEGYGQLENGVGMLRLLTEEVKEGIRDCLIQYRKHGLTRFLPKPFRKFPDTKVLKREVSIATGKLAYPFIRQYAKWIQKVFPNVICHVYCIRNDFFGEQITVSGLITGIDLMTQLKGKNLGSELLLPVNMFRSGEEVFLDDYTRTDLENTLQKRVIIVKSSGQDLVRAILGMTDPDEEKASHSPYELTELNQ